VFQANGRFSCDCVCSVCCLAARVATIVIYSTLAFAQGQSPLNYGPPQMPEWQAAAGGQKSFEVASIRPGDPDRFIHPTIDLSTEDSPIVPGGAFIADFPLPVYIEFAYKILLTNEQTRAMVAHLPRWVGTQPFVIEAKAPMTKVTKDQMRLMMQSLLANRFKLAVHFETRDQPVLALGLAKAGARGPRLRLHAQGLACDGNWSAPTDRTSPSVPPGGFLPSCGVFVAINAANHTILFGARNVTLHSIAGNLGTLPPVAQFGRPVVDQTGLAGTYDFSLQWLPDRTGPQSDDVAAVDAQGATFEEALRDQLGLKLKPARAAVETLVIDHVEEPSPN
jgi:bla regulator protein blaR1